MRVVAQIHLTIDGVRVGYAAREVLRGVSLSVPAGEFLGIIGPNGSGKSTLLKCISRVLPPAQGAVHLSGQEVYRTPQREVARRLAVVAQEHPAVAAFTVGEVVRFGRIPHQGRWQAETMRDAAAVRRAMELTGTAEWSDRCLEELSGGEKQLVFLAQALAQEPEILLLDEPTAHLDLSHQNTLMQRLQQLNRDLGLTIIAVLHDLNLAAQFCRTLVLLQSGRVYALGSPAEVITAANIRAVYGSEVIVAPHPVLRCPTVLLTAPASAASAGGQRVHVIGGGGTGAALLYALRGAGYTVTCGVLNRGDSDWQMAQDLGIPCLEAPPFSPVPPDLAVENTAWCRQADLVVLTEFPFGPGNLANLDAAVAALANGTPVLAFRPGNPAERDYTGGIAATSFEQIQSHPLTRIVSAASEIGAVRAFFTARGED